MYMQRNGFTLIELSIVLVIIGLIVGGVLVGRDLIKAAEIRSFIAEYQEFVTATHTYKVKYNALPGDDNNATSIFGKSATYCNSQPGTAGTPGTCNGDGNQIISLPGAPSSAGENYMYWQQLALSGLIKGSYSGISGAGSSYQAVASNSPQSSFNNGAWFLFNWYSTITGDGSIFDGSYYDNLFQLGGLGGPGSPIAAVVKPSELYNIDKKIDDGKPALGIVRVRWWSTCTNAGASSNLAADYLITSNALGCVPLLTLK